MNSNIYTTGQSWAFEFFGVTNDLYILYVDPNIDMVHVAIPALTLPEELGMEQKNMPFTPVSKNALDSSDLFLAGMADISAYQADYLSALSDYKNEMGDSMTVFTIPIQEILNNIVAALLHSKASKS